MFRTKRKRVPEGGAVVDDGGLDAEAYGRIMLERLGAEYRRFAEWAVRSGAPKRGGKVLEIGPGPGWVSVLVAGERPDLEIRCVDASADMVRACAANFASAGISERARVVQGRAEALSRCAEGPFDLIYSRDSLHHWDDPSAAFIQARDLLSDDGVLVLADERRDLGPGARLLVAILSRRMGRMGRFWRSSIAAAYTPEELESFLVGAGFGRVEVWSGPIDLRATARK